VRVLADGPIHRQTRADFIICPMLYAIATGQIKSVKGLQISASLFCPSFGLTLTLTLLSLGSQLEFLAVPMMLSRSRLQFCALTYGEIKMCIIVVVVHHCPVLNAR